MNGVKSTMNEKLICRLKHKCKSCSSDMKVRKVGYVIPEFLAKEEDKMKMTDIRHYETIAHLVGKEISHGDASKYLMVCPNCTHASNLSALLETVAGKMVIV